MEAWRPEGDLSGLPILYIDGRHDTWEQLAIAPFVDPVTAAKSA